MESAEKLAEIYEALDKTPRDLEAIRARHNSGKPITWVNQMHQARDIEVLLRMVDEARAERDEVRAEFLAWQRCAAQVRNEQTANHALDRLQWWESTGRIVAERDEARAALGAARVNGIAQGYQDGLDVAIEILGDTGHTQAKELIERYMEDEE